MDRPFADLHVHSFYSDGSMSPEEIIEAAVSNGVGTLAVADHDLLDGSIRTQALCRDNGVHCISAVEIDTLDNGENFHILAYGFDAENSAFLDFLRHTRFMLDEASVKLVERMRPDHPDFSLEDYDKFTYDRCLGGWKALHYLMKKGLTPSLKEGIQFYSRYGVSHSQSGFSTIAATAYRIKLAGGYSVLAHPGALIDASDINAFTRELRRLVAYGLDGIECYYPWHSEAITQACLDVCNEHDLLITAGSDCHGAFGKTRVGEMNIRTDQLRLKGLRKNR